MLDILDRMHNKARQGASLRRMIEAFPHMPPESIAYWMRSNNYARNGMTWDGATQRIFQADENASFHAVWRAVRKR